jgi:hypothetical protein
MAVGLVPASSENTCHVCCGVGVVAVLVSLELVLLEEKEGKPIGLESLMASLSIEPVSIEPAHLGFDVQTLQSLASRKWKDKDFHSRTC